MPTISQLVRKGGKSIERTTKSPALRDIITEEVASRAIYNYFLEAKTLTLRKGISKDKADDGIELQPIPGRAQSSRDIL